MPTISGGEPNYASPTFISVGVVSALVIAANILRKQLLLVNDSDSPIYLAFANDTAVVGSGTRLNANGGSLQVGGPGGIALDTSQINAIAGAASKNMTIQEAT